MAGIFKETFAMPSDIILYPMQPTPECDHQIKVTHECEECELLAFQEIPDSLFNTWSSSVNSELFAKEGQR